MMAKFDSKKNWWIVVVATALLGVAVILIVDQWLPAYSNIGAFVGFGLIGAGFCWAYAINREKLWWTIIPGLAMFTLVGAGLADTFIGTDPANDWASVLVVGAGAAIIGAVLTRKAAKQVLFIVALFALIIGIIMAPFTWLIRGILITAAVLIVGFFLLRNR